MLLGVIMQGSLGIAAAFSPSITVFIILRFLIALTSTGMYMCCFVLGQYHAAPTRELGFMWTYHSHTYLLLAIEY